MENTGQASLSTVQSIRHINCLKDIKISWISKGFRLSAMEKQSDLAIEQIT